MHKAASARGTGVGVAVLAHLLDRARERGLSRVSLETGTSEGFAAARRLYAAAGFLACEPFGAYRPSPHSAFLTRVLDPAVPPGAGPSGK